MDWVHLIMYSVVALINLINLFKQLKLIGSCDIIVCICYVSSRVILELLMASSYVILTSFIWTLIAYCHSLGCTESWLNVNFLKLAYCVLLIYGYWHISGMHHPVYLLQSLYIFKLLSVFYWSNFHWWWLEYYKKCLDVAVSSMYYLCVHCHYCIISLCYFWVHCDWLPYLVYVVHHSCSCDIEYTLKILNQACQFHSCLAFGMICSGTGAFRRTILDFIIL